MDLWHQSQTPFHSFKSVLLLEKAGTSKYTHQIIVQHEGRRKKEAEFKAAIIKTT